MYKVRKVAELGDQHRLALFRKYPGEGLQLWKLRAAGKLTEKEGIILPDAKALRGEAQNVFWAQGLKCVSEKSCAPPKTAFAPRATFMRVAPWCVRGFVLPGNEVQKTFLHPGGPKMHFWEFGPFSVEFARPAAFQAFNRNVARSSIFFKSQN